jgi:hypothetical protein
MNDPNNEDDHLNNEDDPNNNNVVHHNNEGPQDLEVMGEEQHQPQEEDDDVERRRQRVFEDLEAAGINIQDLSERLTFDSQTKKISENDPNFCLFDAPIRFDDETAIQLGTAMVGTTELKGALIKIGDGLTARGARALVGGILGSCVEFLSISTDNDALLPMELAPIYVYPIQTISNMGLTFPLEDPHATKFGACLEGNQSLKTLVFHIRHLSPNGALAMSKGICQSQLSNLDVVFHTDEPDEDDEHVNNHDNPDTKTVMQTLYSQGMQHCQTLEYLSLDGCLGDVSSLVTNVLFNIRELSIDQVELSVTETQILSDGLMQTRNLEVLSLCRCRLSNEHMRVLAASIGDDRLSIQKLTIQNQPFGDDGIASFIEHWNEDSKIRRLDLSENPNIGCRGAQQLLSAVANHIRARKLILASNRGVGYDGLYLMGQELPGKMLLEVDLQYTAEWVEYENVESKEAMEQQAKRHRAGQSILEGIRGNFFLQRLKLEGVNLEPSVANEVKLYLRANRGFRWLLIRQHRLPPAFWSHFLAKHRKSRSLIFLFLRELHVLMRSHVDDRMEAEKSLPPELILAMEEDDDSDVEQDSDRKPKRRRRDNTSS